MSSRRTSPVTNDSLEDGLDPRKLQVVYLLLARKTQAEAAAAVGVDPKTVGRWLQEPAMKREFAQQLAALAAELWAKLLTITDEVWTVFIGHLHSDDPRISLRAATWFLDRVLSLQQLSAVLENGTGTPLPRALVASLEEVAYPNKKKEGRP